MKEFLILSLVILLVTGSVAYAIIITILYYAMRNSRNLWKDLAFKQAKNIAEYEAEIRKDN